MKKEIEEAPCWHTNLLMWTWCRWKIGTNQITAIQGVRVREISGHLKEEKGEDLARWGRGEDEGLWSRSLNPKIILSVYWAWCTVGQRPVWKILNCHNIHVSVWTSRNHVTSTTWRSGFGLFCGFCFSVLSHAPTMQRERPSYRRVHFICLNLESWLEATCFYVQL